MRYPNREQVQAATIVTSALRVAGLSEIFTREALECAAREIERNHKAFGRTPAGEVLKQIAAHIRREIES